MTCGPSIPRLGDVTSALAPCQGWCNVAFWWRFGEA